MTQTLTMKIKDRNLTAYLLANGFICKFVPRPLSNNLDAEFLWSEDFDRA